MDNLGAIGGPLLAIGLVALTSVRTAILISIIPGLLAAIAIVMAIRFAPKLTGMNASRSGSACARCCAAASAG